jgi:hypothetical protein
MKTFSTESGDPGNSSDAEAAADRTDGELPSSTLSGRPVCYIAAIRMAENYRGIEVL